MQNTANAGHVAPSGCLGRARLDDRSADLVIHWRREAGSALKRKQTPGPRHTLQVVLPSFRQLDIDPATLSLMVEGIGRPEYWFDPTHLTPPVTCVGFSQVFQTGATRARR
jgi:hypothetical protein